MIIDENDKLHRNAESIFLDCILTKDEEYIRELAKETNDAYNNLLLKANINSPYFKDDIMFKLGMLECMRNSLSFATQIFYKKEDIAFIGEEVNYKLMNIIIMKQYITMNEIIAKINMPREKIAPYLEVLEEKDYISQFKLGEQFYVTGIGMDLMQCYNKSVKNKEVEKN